MTSCRFQQKYYALLQSVLTLIVVEYNIYIYVFIKWQRVENELFINEFTRFRNWFSKQWTLVFPIGLYIYI